MNEAMLVALAMLTPPAIFLVCLLVLYARYVDEVVVEDDPYVQLSLEDL